MKIEKVSLMVFLCVKIGRKYWVLLKKEYNVMYFEKNDVDYCRDCVISSVF